MVDERLCVLSPEARNVFERIGRGQVLRVPDDGGKAYLVNTNRGYTDSLSEIEVSDKTVAELLNTNCLHALEPDRVQQRCGWKELGVFGFEAKIYCLAQ